MKKRAQLNFVNVLFIVIAFMFLLAVLPVAQASIDTMFPTADTFTGAVIHLFPAIMILALIAVFFFYVFPRRAE